jgi:hypothetical protein
VTIEPRPACSGSATRPATIHPASPVVNLKPPLKAAITWWISLGSIWDP